jgi:hypothetical protein
MGLFFSLPRCDCRIFFTELASSGLAVSYVCNANPDSDSGTEIRQEGKIFISWLEHNSEHDPVITEIQGPLVYGCSSRFRKVM